MEPTQKDFPIFEANQVLTSEHLNTIFTYLDEQERLTRAHLIGIGIVCGLQVKLGGTNTDPIIHISKGCGVTSQGFQINVPDDLQLTHYRADYTIENQYETGSALDPFEQFQVPGSDPAVQVDLWELFEAGEEDNALPLGDTPGLLNNKAVLLFLELKQQGLRNCSPNNCDDKGSQVRATVKCLLIDTTHLNDLNLPLLPEVPVPRVNFFLPEDLQQHEKIYKNFFSSTIEGKTVVIRLSEAINQVFQVLQGFIPDLDNTGVSQLTSKYASLNSGSTIAIQYYYGLLRDLTAAYHELRTALLRQPALCIPNSAAFPRHLVLGALASGSGSLYRTPLYSSPAVASSGHTLADLRFLFERLNQMVSRFNIPSGSQVTLRVTPSLFGQKYLSGKSMPYYYEPELREFWDAARKGLHAQEILTWHGSDDATNPEYVRNPLRFDLEPYNFFRVEGHVGKNLLNLVTSLNELLRDRRMPFSVLYLDTDAIGDFLEQHFAIEHEAGALRGGTLVVVHGGSGSNVNTVLCDFALPYRIETRSSECVCKADVKECSYEWFDTRKHLSHIARHPYSNNLSREAEKTLLAKNYVIVIYHYEIEGQSLLSGSQPVKINIPFSELRNGQLSAIARRLNEKFPGGLVFDYDSDKNKLLIRFFSDQSFRIEWGGLQGNQIRYAYTDEKVYRWQKKAWEDLDIASQFKVTCRQFSDYCVDQYKWLHENTCYAAKYPAAVNMATLDEVIKWEEMIHKRADARKNSLPITGLLQSIKILIKDKDEDATVVLIGSWANGSWVSSNSADNKFPPGFVTLRQKITGKTGPSDIDLLVDCNKTAREAIQNAVRKESPDINLVWGKKDAQKGIVL